jgi:HJR/Mrr/RecB family endonuclease
MAGHGSGAGAVYAFTRSGATWSQQAYVKASNTDASDQFGLSVALSADGATLAVGANRERSAATGGGGNQTGNSAVGAGAVYVFY